MSDSSNDVKSETLLETASDVIEPTLDESSNRTWKNVEIINSFGDDYNQQCHNLLRKTVKTVTSPLGDISIHSQVVKFTLDRAILSSRSNFLFEDLIQHDEKDIDNMMNNDDERFSNIVDIIYGKDLKLVLSETNFSQLFADMNKMKMEIDLKIFEHFIDDNIKPKEELNDYMFDLYNLLSNSDQKCDYLLPTVSLYFSDRLLKIYDRKEFLSLSFKGIVQILLNKRENCPERGFIGRVCAEWICNDFQNRVNHMKDLVNVAKYRYGILPYCDWDPDLTKSLQRSNGSDGPQVREVEKYFNELSSYYGKAKYGSPSILKELCGIYSNIVHPIDRVTRWMEILEKGHFCDVAINVQGTVFKLHRVKLSLASDYFRNLFINRNEPSNLQTEKESTSKSMLKEYSLDQTDPETFKSVIRYIYKQKVKVTSETNLVNLIKISRLLKMDDLFEKCSSIMLQKAKDKDLDNIFEAFQCVCENAKYSNLYRVLIETIETSWPTLDQIPHFENIPLDVLKEILALPDLLLKNSDEILDLCSKWILHDIENRYHFTFEVAKAINRNFMMDYDQLRLEIPLNSTDYSLEFVKEQLIKILSSTTLVPLNTNCIENKRQKPRFLLLNEDKFLSVVDMDFNEIIQLAQIGEATFHCSGTIIDDELFILFKINNEAYFQSYSLATGRMVFLATDHEYIRSSGKFVILNCNNEVYYLDCLDVLKYSARLNRWISVSRSHLLPYSLYTSDGKKMYRISRGPHNESIKGRFSQASFYDFVQKEWISLPDIPEIQRTVVTTDTNGVKKQQNVNAAISTNIINHEFGVLFSSSTYLFNWVTQTWKSIPNSKNNFMEFTGYEQDIVYISNENEVHVYSPILKQSTLERKLTNFSNIVAIHTIEK